MKSKIYFLLLTAAISITTVLAQPVIGLQKTIGGNNEDQFTCMILTRDGGTLCGGFSSSNKSGNKKESSKGSADYWLVKLSNKGAIQWSKTIGGSQYDELRAIEQTRDGGYILGGYSYSGYTGDKTDISRGQTDYWVVKLDSNGNKQWDKTYGGIYYDELRALKQTSDGGYLLGGYSSSNISGEKTENSYGFWDYWVIKTDGNGNKLWDKTIGGWYEDKLFAIAQTKDDGYLLGGYSSSYISGNKTEASRGTYDYWIVKIDNNGVIKWDKTIGGAGADFLTAITPTSDDGFVLGGYSTSNISGEKLQNGRGIEDYWIVKTDSAGVIQWSNTYGANKNDYLSSVQQTTDDGYILGGYSNSDISGEKTESTRGFYDYWLIKLNKAGKQQWDKTIGGLQTDGEPLVAELERNRYIAGGYSYSGITGDKTSDNKGITLSTNDYWLVELKYSKPDSVITALPNTLLVNSDKSNAGFTVYPNPAKNVLCIKVDGKASFSLTDQSGKIILTKTITNSGYIDICKVPPGIYFLLNKSTGIAQKVVISK